MSAIRYLFVFTILISNLFAFECDKNDTSIEIGTYRGTLDGYIQIGRNSNASKLDIKNDLDITKSQTSLLAILNKSYKRHKFSFKLSRYKTTGKKKLSSDIIYNSEHFAKATIVKSKLDLRWAKLKYRYKVSHELSVGTDLNGIRMYSYINNNSYRKIFFMPSFAIDYNIDLADDLMFVTKTSLTPLGDYKSTDAYAGIAYKLGFSNCSYLHLGYQISNLTIKSKKLSSDLNYKGAYAGVKVKF